MIDDERLQELLSKASSLYNGGEYKEAISAWKEALGVDPGSQKAQEGIRMATLLLGDLDGGGTEEEAVTLPADGAEPSEQSIPPEEAEARIDLGVARVKQLLAERKYSEAIEGAQGLLPLDPQSPEILSLLEQAQHAFESAPFIEEHLVLARELLAQERFAEAEAECKKVFTVDATHPGARGLLKEIRDKIQTSLKAAASQLGGMTVKMSMPQAIAAGLKPGTKTPAPPTAPAPKPAEPVAATRPPLPEMYEEPGPAPEQEPQVFETGEAAMAQEDVSARAALEAAFADPVLGGPKEEESPFELAGEGAGAIGVPEPPSALEPEPILEAKTVRPPTSRVVPREPASAAPPAPPADAADAKPSPSAPVTPPPVVSSHAKKGDEGMHKPAAVSTVKPSPARPAKTEAAKGAPAAPAKTPVAPTVPVAPTAADETTAWETELTQLNLKDKERGLLRGTKAKATGKAPEAGEMDLMSLLDSGGLPGMPQGEREAPGPPVEAVPLAKPKESAKPAPRPSSGKGAAHAEAKEEAAAPAEAVATATRVRKPEKPRPVPTSGRGRSSLMRFLLLLLVLGALGGGGWYVYNQPGLLPRLLGGGGQPSHPVAPPAGAPAGSVEGGHGPIPTPIGNTSRQQTAPQPAENPSASASIGGPSPGGPAPAAPSPNGQVRGVPPGGAGAQGTTAAPGSGATTPAASATPASNEPIKPQAVPALSKEETQRRIVAYTADGKRLLASGKWREARAKLNAVLALDPANLEVKDLSDKAQAKIDEEQKLTDEFDSTKKLYADKDYEAALRKLYRLPRDKGLGDIDLYIRNAWYNWAVVLLKAGNSKDALAKLSEELTVDPDDAAALKLQEVAEKYTNRAKDRTYYAFTDGLALRPFEQK